MAVMTKRRKAKSNGHVNGTLRQRVELPRGTGLAPYMARGVIRWREKLGLTSYAAAEKCGIDPTTFSRLERAYSDGVAGKQFRKICEASGMDLIDLLILGKPE